MTQKPFGVKQLNVIGAAGTPTIESAGDLNIGGQQVAITTNTSIAGVITATSFFGDGSGLTGITGSGSGVVIQEEGSSVGTAGTINFIGTGVTATLSGGIASVEITSTGGGGGGIDGISTTGTSFFNQLNVSGVSTFQGDAYFGDNDYIRMGDANGGDLRFYHAGGAGSYIDHVNSNDLYIRAGSGSGSTKLRITDTSNNLKAIFDTDNTSGGVELYYGQNQKKFETTGYGVTVFGTTESQQLNVTGVSTFQGNLDFGDNVKLRLGDSQDLEIYHDGTFSRISDVGSGPLLLETNGSSIQLNKGTTHNMLVATPDGSVDLYHNGNQKLATTGTGATVYGTTETQQLNVSGVTTHQGDIYLGDSDVLRFGTGSGGFGDLQIWHDSFHSYVRDNGTGNLRLKTNNLIELVSGGTDEVMGQFASDAGVGLYYNGQKKFETTNGGAVVTGILTATSFSGDGSALTNISASVPANLTATTLNVSGVTTAANFRTNSTTGDGSDVGFAIKYYITSNGSSSYRFAGPGLINTTDNPTLYLHRGFTYIFENSTGGSHPFRIQFTGTTTGVGTYVSGSQSGTQVFTIPFDAPSSYEYQCTLHSGMKGTLAIPT